MSAYPASETAIASALAFHGEGANFKATLERLLLELDEARADALMLLLKESRGAWAVLLGGDEGRALLLGNALSGTVTALATLGWRVVVGDPSAARARLAAVRDADVTPGLVRHVRLDPESLPFADDAFDLVVLESGATQPAARWDPAVAEVTRVARGERVLVADNRLAYKRSTGLRGRFHVPSPLEWVRTALRPPQGERTLVGYRRLLGEPARAFALYPHSREFSFVVAIDAQHPRLTIGPQERANRAKVFAHKLGLFPWLTPSFALLAGARDESRLERVLDRLAEILDEPRGEPDLFISSRSNTAVILTGEPDRPGGWVLHIPLGANKADLVTAHAHFLRWLPSEYPDLPLPELLFEGEICGMHMTVERRLGGVSAPQITGDVERTRTMFLDLAGHLASLTRGASRAMDGDEFERLIAERLDRVRDLCGVTSTARTVEAQKEALRDVLVGRLLPRTVYHGDLRSKHVQVTDSGRVLGLLDWGASEEEFLPYVDMLHCVVQQRKQEGSEHPAEAWGALVRGELRSHEREALDLYAARLELDEEVRGALERAYPVLAAGMAERNWDYSRPRWVHSQYGL